MSRLATRAFWFCTLLASLGLSCRLLWVASQTETGLETLRLQWRDATWGLAVGNRTPIHSQEPAEQAELWQREVDRVLELHKGNTQMAMGAALVLDSPSPEYAGRYLTKIETIPGFGAFPELDRQGLKQAEDAFESHCREKCLEFAAKATELDPDEVEWWRLRALLLWRYSMYSYDEAPRTTHWLEILDQAARHDSENALYDYLAAFFYWESSAEMEFVNGNEQLIVKDAERFNRGISRFARGQRKPYFAVGDAGFPAVAEFLRHTAIPLTDRETIVNSRTIHLRRSVLLRSVWRWHGLRGDEAAAAGEVMAALTMKRQSLRLIDQFTSAGPFTEYDNVAIACRVATAVQMNTLANDYEDLFTADELQEINALEEDARLTNKVIEQAARELAANRPQRPSGISFTGSPGAVICAVVVGISPSVAVILLLVGFAAIALSRVAKHRDLPKIGAIRQSLSLAAACAVTVVFFGLAPSKIIPHTIQAWVLTVLVVVTPIVLLSWIAWSWLRRRAFKFSLRAMLISVFLLCVLFGLVSITRPRAESFTQIPFDLSIPSRGWEGLDATSLGSALRPGALWLWAVLQWTAYYGQYLTIVLWATITAVLLRFKVRSTNGGLSLTFGDHMGAWSRSFGHACLTLSVQTLIVYLTFTPTLIADVEQEFQDKMAFARQPSTHWSAVVRAVQHVQSNPERMKQLRAAVKAEIAEARSSASRE